jgi:hypothetical protein
MPPKKRGRPPGQPAAAPSRPTKRVRVGETSIIGEQNSSDVIESGRPRRSSAGEPDYNTKRTRAPNKASASSSTQTNAPKANVTKKRKAASKLFGKRRPSTTPKLEPEAIATPKRGRGRPPKSTKITAKPAHEETITTPKKPVGRPKKVVRSPVKAVGRSKSHANAVQSTSGAASKKDAKATVKQDDNEDEVEGSDAAAVAVGIPNGTSSHVGDFDAEEAELEETGLQYWLMKAEPNSRMEKGVDVKFSIDDLKAKGGPEAWDGVRNHAARNNMRAMRKGDVAFFYHSNCKSPGIVGMMEIVGEHAIDGTYHVTRFGHHARLLIYYD